MVYIYDGSENGFFTAFVRAFSDETARILSGNAQLPLGQAVETVLTDDCRAERAKARLTQFDKRAIHDARTLLRCGKDDRDEVTFAYLRTLALHKKPVRNILTNACVFRAVEYMKKVGTEIHHLHGFLRFMEVEGGGLYAPITPDNDICDWLLPHFRARFPAQAFVIHDVKRKKAAFYDGKEGCVFPLERADILLSANEADYQALWKKYYAAVNIPSRRRLKQMVGYMPRRYWAFLPEKQGEDLPID